VTRDDACRHSFIHLPDMTDNRLQQMKRSHCHQRLPCPMADLGRSLMPPPQRTRVDLTSLYTCLISRCHGTHQCPEGCHTPPTFKTYLHTHFSELWNSGRRLSICDDNLVLRALIIGLKARQSHHTPEVTITILFYPLHPSLQMMTPKVQVERVILGKER
jgi:hypothetical protein